jgi:hypothetical protein
MDAGSSQVPPSTGRHIQTNIINLDRPVVIRRFGSVTS